MNEYLTFRKFITPMIIQIIFWVGVVAIVLLSLMAIAAGLGSYGGGQIVLGGLLYLVLGPLFWRIWCELMLIIFRIHDELHQMRTGRPAPETTPPAS